MENGVLVAKDKKGSGSPSIYAELKDLKTTYINFT